MEVCAGQADHQGPARYAGICCEKHGVCIDRPRGPCAIGRRGSALHRSVPTVSISAGQWGQGGLGPTPAVTRLHPQCLGMLGSQEAPRLRSSEEASGPLFVPMGAPWLQGRA